LLNFILLI